MQIQLSLFFFVEAAGTIAFASSGAMVAVKKQLDLLGVIVLGVTTAVGGGMLRDIIIGKVPPSLFINPIYVFLAFLTVVILFFIIRLNQQILASRSIGAYERIMNIFDAVGLGAFTVTGIDTAVLEGYGDYKFLVVFLGVITGIGGGILRDIMAGETPFILRKHVYASASIAGAFVYAFLMNRLNTSVSILAGAFTVILIRVLATRYRWNLPTATKKKKSEDSDENR